MAATTGSKRDMAPVESGAAKAGQEFMQLLREIVARRASALNRYAGSERPYLPRPHGRVFMLNNNLTTWAARVVLLVFAGWTTIVVIDHGYTGFLQLAAEQHWGAQMLVDLGIALVLFTLWMIDDARGRGTTVWPFVVLTLFTGSIGPLLYLSLRRN